MFPLIYDVLYVVLLQELVSLICNQNNWFVSFQMLLAFTVLRFPLIPKDTLRHTTNRYKALIYVMIAIQENWTISKPDLQLLHHQKRFLELERIHNNSKTIIITTNDSHSNKAQVATWGTTVTAVIRLTVILHKLFFSLASPTCIDTILFWEDWFFPSAKISSKTAFESY